MKQQRLRAWGEIAIDGLFLTFVVIQDASSQYPLRGIHYLVGVNILLFLGLLFFWGDFFAKARSSDRLTRLLFQREKGMRLALCLRASQIILFPFVLILALLLWQRVGW